MGITIVSTLKDDVRIKNCIQNWIIFLQFSLSFLQNRIRSNWSFVLPLLLGQWKFSSLSLWDKPSAKFSVFFFFFRATPAAYGSSQARVESELQLRPTPQPQQHQIRVTSVTHSEACSNVRSLTHWLRLEIEPASAWILVGFLTLWAAMGTPMCIFLIEP